MYTFEELKTKKMIFKNIIWLFSFVLLFGCSSDDPQTFSDDFENELKVLISSDNQALYVGTESGKIYDRTFHNFSRLGVYNKMDDAFYSIRYDNSDLTYLVKIPASQFREGELNDNVIFEEYLVSNLGSYWLQQNILFDSNNNLVVICMNNATPEKLGYGTLQKNSGEFNLTYFGLDNTQPIGIAKFYLNPNLNKLFLFSVPPSPNSSGYDSFLSAVYSLNNNSSDFFSNYSSYGIGYYPNTTDVFQKDIDNNFYFVSGNPTLTKVVKFDSNVNSFEFLNDLPNNQDYIDALHVVNSSGKIYYKTSNQTGGFRINIYNIVNGEFKSTPIRTSDYGVYIYPYGDELIFID